MENDKSKMIAYGILASSSHNMQPWLVKPTSSDTIELYADMDKALHVVDGDYKQLLMSQGTFVESYKQGALQYGYGLSLNTLPGILKPFIQPIMKSSSSNWEAFGDSGIKQFKERLAQQTKYVLIKCDNSSNLEYIYSGQIYQKLIFEVSNYNLRPAMQALENFDSMKSLNMQFQQEYGGDGEVVWIIGVQEKTKGFVTSNPRHLVEDILIQ